MVRAPCCEKAGLKRGRWTAEEDELLLKYIQANGEGSWRSLPKSAGLLRCGKSCRLRWTNYLRPNLKRGKFTSEEDETIVKLQCSLGNRWSLIASYLPGRTDNEIKNYWNSHLRRRIYTFRMKKKPIKTTAEVPKMTIVADGINCESLRKCGRVSRSKAKKYNHNTTTTATAYISSLKPKSSCVNVGAHSGATWSEGDSIEFDLSEIFTIDTAYLATLEGIGLDMQQHDEHYAGSAIGKPRNVEREGNNEKHINATPEEEEVCHGIWSFEETEGKNQKQINATPEKQLEVCNGMWSFEETDQGKNQKQINATPEKQLEVCNGMWSFEETEGKNQKQIIATPEKQLEVCNGMWFFEEQGQQVLDEQIPNGPHETNAGDETVHNLQQPNYCLHDFDNQVTLSGVLEINEESHENWWSAMTSDNFLEDELWVDQCSSMDVEFGSNEEFDDMLLWLWDDI